MVETTETAKQVTPIWKCEVKDCPVTFPPTLKGYHQMTGHQLRHANEGLPKDKRGYHLEDESTGEVLARSIKEAMPFLMEETPKEKKKVEPPISETPPREVPKAPAKAELPKEKPKETPPEDEPPVEPPEAELPKEKPKETPPEDEPPVEPPEAELPKEKPKAKEKESEITTPQALSSGIFRYTITLPADAFTLFNLAKTCGLEKDSEKLFDEWLWDCIRMRYKTDYKMRLVLAPEEK